MAIPGACALLFFISALLSLITSPSTANDNNVLLTGEVLSTDCQLSYLDTTFTMQRDCNLVLYQQKKPTFDSATYDRGYANCSVAFNDYGQLVITAPDGTPLWSSSDDGPKQKGKYAAVLRPNGQVGVYGPVVWSTPVFTPTAADADAMYGEGLYDETALGRVIKNTLFSSEVIVEGEELLTRDYVLGMTDTCSLELRRGESSYLWVSGTVGRSRNCFLRLNRRGQLTIKDDQYTTLWSTDPSPQGEGEGEGEGEYVLILQSNGQAAVYGPLAWSTQLGEVVPTPPPPPPSTYPSSMPAMSPSPSSPMPEMSDPPV